jgi:hypothetical protein
MPQGRPAYWCHPGCPLSTTLPEQLAIGAHFGFEIGWQVGRSGAGFSDRKRRHQFFDASTAQGTGDPIVPALDHLVEIVAAVSACVFKQRHNEPPVLF